MAAADQGGPGPDHYQLLGVARGASREEITQAWRRLGPGPSIPIAGRARPVMRRRAGSAPWPRPTGC